MILLAAPDQERLGRVVEDASSCRPVAAGVGRLEEPVSLLEQEVVVDQLLLHDLGHPRQGVVHASVVPVKILELKHYLKEEEHTFVYHEI